MPDAYEVARRVLPYYLLPSFKNTITGFVVQEADKTRPVYEIRNVEIYKSSLADIIIPGSGTLLYVPRLSFTSDVDEEAKRIRVFDITGLVAGFLPDGKRARILVPDDIKDLDSSIILEYDDYYTDFAVSTVVRNIVRLKASKYFAARVATVARRWCQYWRRSMCVKLRMVTVAERGVRGSIDIETTLYRFTAGGVSFDAPNIVAGVSELMARGVIKPVNEEALDVLKQFLKDLTSVGRRLVPLCPLLQRTSKAVFSYYIGEVTSIHGKPRKRYVWLGGAPAYRGVRVNVYADLEAKRVLTQISLLPYNPPAVLVLNYPPFIIAPLTALVHQRRLFLQTLMGEARRRAAALGIKAVTYEREYEALGEAGVTFDDIRRALFEGYPRIGTLRAMLEKLEKLGGIADVMSFALANDQLEKIDKILLKEVAAVVEGEAVEEKTSEAREMEEEILL